MKKVFLLISLFVSSTSLAAIYQWQDEHGVTHYSDDSHHSTTTKPKTLKVLKPIANKISIPKAAPPAQELSPPVLSTAKISFISPQEQQTIRNNIGEITVIANLSDPIKATDKIRLLVDHVIKKEHHSPEFNLRSIELGEHTLQLQLISQSGKILASSQLITIYMHRFKAN